MAFEYDDYYYLVDDEIQQKLQEVNEHLIILYADVRDIQDLHDDAAINEEKQKTLNPDKDKINNLLQRYIDKLDELVREGDRIKVALQNPDKNYFMRREKIDSAKKRYMPNTGTWKGETS